MLEVIPDSKKFLVEFNFQSCDRRYESIKTLEDAYLSDKIKIRELANCYSEETVILWIETWLTYLSKLMDFKISPEQSNMTSRFIIEELYMLNIAEITMFFRRLIKGKYGEFYGKFNPQKILVSAMEYRKERGKIVVKNN